MAKLWQFLQGHPKPVFSVKVQRGDQGKFFKNRPKSSPCLKGRKRTLAQMALSSNLYAFKMQTLDNILAQTAARKVPERPSYNNFRKVTQNPHLMKKCKRGTKGNFQSTVAEMALSFI